MRRARKITKTALVLALILFASYTPTLFHPVRAATAPSFTFTAAGDYGGITAGSCGSITTDTCARLVAKKIAVQNPLPAFHIALGDFGYSDQNPSSWCGSFKTIYPGTSGGALAIVAGNHDTWTSSTAYTYGDSSTGLPSDVITHEDGPGFLDTYTSPSSGPGYASACGLPSGINWVGSGTSNAGLTCTTDNNVTAPTCYGREYYFDYPASNPIMRFIFVSAGIGGPWPNYNVGSPSYNWLKARIDDAKNAGLWVAVALHKDCLSDGTVHTSCESTFDPFNLALTDGVDLWLNGHEHNYERSYQLSSCTGSGTTVSSCQTNTGTFVRGSGMVVNIIGTGGNGNYAICSTNCTNQNYFQKLCGSNNDIGISQTSGCNNDYGFVKFTVDTNKIVGTYVSATGIFSDTYVIHANNPPGDFGVSSNIARVARGTIGASGTYSSVAVVSANSFGNFSGTVNLALASVSGGPAGICPGSNCPTVSLSRTTLSVTSGGSDSVILTVSSTPATTCSNPDNSPGVARYTVMVIATSGSTTHQYIVLIYIYGRGDVDKNGIVNILDVAAVAVLFGSNSTQPNFDPNRDLDNNGLINIVDVATVAFYFGLTGC